MHCSEFLNTMVYGLDGTSLECLKSMLSDMHITFYFVENDNVDAAVLCEKLSDYFKMVGMNMSRSFEDCISAYMDGLNTIVEPRIARASQPNVVPRAWKYYERFAGIRLSRHKIIDDVIDYSRIMFCLYESIIEIDMKPIEDFDYDRDALDPVAIVEAMRSEEGRGLFRRQGSRLFDTSEAYEMGTCIIIIAMIVLSTLMYVADDSEEGEGHEY